MKVLILGAGASVTAGYPLSAQLINAVGKHVEQSSSMQYRADWEQWEKYRAQTDGLIRSLVYSANPEVALSVPDLFEAAIAAEDQRQFDHAKAQYEENPDEPLTDYDNYFDSPIRNELRKAVAARKRFVRCLNEFFAHRHAFDSENREQRDYLRELFASLTTNDAVITLNWDTTAERTLGEEGKWNPVAGYGFRKQLGHRYHQMQELVFLPDGATESSVQILKLHGSFGWVIRNDALVFERARYLAHMPFEYERNNVWFWDPAEPATGVPDDFVMSYPSFLKRFDRPEQQLIWHRAAEALNEANQIDIWGYSLPESDSAVRVLLAGLRTRAGNRECKITVHDKDSNSLYRWRRFLGSSVQYESEYLE